MTVYAVERVKQIMDSMVAESIFPMVRQTELVEKAKSFFSDAACQKHFEKELIFLALLPVVGAEKSYAISPNFSEQVWDNAAKNLAVLQRKKQLPVLKAPYPSDSPLDRFYSISIFSLQQYLFKNLGVSENDVVLDIGANVGHFAFWADSKKAKKIYAAESDPELFGFLELNKNEHDKQNIIPCNLFFAHEKGTAEYINKETRGKKEVSVVTLDSWCSEQNIEPDFIKVSLDKNTMPALIGASAVIKKYKPRLAVVINRKISDMWEIPLYIKSLVPSYKLYCRKNAPIGDFILYATTGTLH